MTNQSKFERAKDLFFGKPTLGIKDDPSERQPSDWFAQPAIGADIKTYTTSPSHPEPPEYLDIAPIIEKNRQRIKALALKNGVCNVRVFGSMAKNEAGPRSDIDLLVDIQQGETGLALGGFLVDVADLTQRKVNVITEKSLHPRLRDKVLREAVLL